MFGYDQNIPYNNLPLLPPTDAIETVTTLKAAISANNALTELKVAGHLIPNQSVLLRAILLQEARVSSEIESIFTTNDDLYRAMSVDRQDTDPHTKEVLTYGEALWQGMMRMEERPLATNLFIEIANIINGTEAGIRRHSGTRIVNGRGETVYTPPEGETQIRDLLANLENYIHAEDGVDPLIKLAVIHYQFEAIHPFHDGNGRTGRILNILYLLDRGLLENPALYLSRYIIENRPDYYANLRRVTNEGDWESWIIYMLKAVEETAILTRNKIADIQKLFTATLERVRQELPKIYSKELVDVLFQQPYCRIQTLDKNGIARRQTAAKYLYALEKIGVLRSVKVGREVLFLNQGLFDILTE